VAAVTGARGERNREKEGAPGREDRAEGGVTVEVLSSWRSFGGGTHPCGKSRASTVTRTSVPGWRKKIRWKFCKNPPGLWGFPGKFENCNSFCRICNSNKFKKL
jgi:hypothetical protein